MPKINDLIKAIETAAPLSFQESYDNCGLLVGDRNAEINSALLTIDITEANIDEAVQLGAGIIISHHPIIFQGLKKITGSGFVERIVLKAIKNNIALYAAHTNLDSVNTGVNAKLCEKLGIKNTKILSPIQGELKKLVVFVPHSHADKVRNSIFEAGAGKIGNYDCCSFNLEGVGTFRGNEAATPFVGKVGNVHNEPETRVETIFPKHLQSNIVNAMISAHPYEEVAYDIYPLDNKYPLAGMGMIGELEQETDVTFFLQNVKSVLNIPTLKHSVFHKSKVKKIAVCGGSGSKLLREAISAKADVFITGEVGYHQYQDTDNKIIIVDAGHFETEQFTTEIFYDVIIKKLPTFALHFTKVNMNPVKYF